MTARPEASRWRTDLKGWLTRSADTVDDFVDIRWRRLRERQGWSRQPRIQAYLGFANDEFAWVHGRVLENPALGGPGEDDRWWERLADSYQRFASREVPDVRVRVRLGDAEEEASTDEEGYFRIRLSSPDEHESLEGSWHRAVLWIVDDKNTAHGQIPETTAILRPPGSSRIGIISDVDDTILHTGATNLLINARRTFFGSARTRLPLPGAAALYRAIQRSREPAAWSGDPADTAGENPVFYVSSSPWNLYDLLIDFLALNSIPRGPVLLRDLGFDDNKFLKSGHDHKLVKARRILDAYPERRFLLVGDSGQDDPRLYATAAREYPDQIAAVFIRDVDPTIESERDAHVEQWRGEAEAVGVPFHLVRDSLEAAEVAADLGILAPSALPTIASAVETDSARW